MGTTTRSPSLIVAAALAGASASAAVTWHPLYKKGWNVKSLLVRVLADASLSGSVLDTDLLKILDDHLKKEVQRAEMSADKQFFCFMAHATPRGGVGIPLKVAAAPAGTEASLSGMRSHPDITVDDDVSALLHGRRQRLATVLWWRGTASAWCRPSS